MKNENLASIQTRCRLYGIPIRTTIYPVTSFKSVLHGKALCKVTQIYLIRDTFRMQTFEGLASDNWDYAITGEALIEDISGVKDIPNSHGNYGLRMPMNTQAAFEHFTLTDHQDIKISIRKGGHPFNARRKDAS